jgi:hypothetical protein
MFEFVTRVFGGRRKAEKIIIHRIRTEKLFYPDERSVETTQILTTVGTAPKQWYTQEALMLYHGAAEELRGFIS